MMPKDIVAAAFECEKTPFKHQGRQPGVGLDCAGLLVHCFKRLGLPYHDEKGYPRTPFDGQLQKILDSQPSLRRISVSEATEGDWLIMRISRDPQHIALHAGFKKGQAYMIHAYSESGSVVHHRIDALNRARIVGAYRMVSE